MGRDIFRLATWNVNGIRAAQRAGFLKWLESIDADAVCLQETKATRTQLEADSKNPDYAGLVSPLGYGSHWASAEKPGYSGVVTYSRQELGDVKVGLGLAEFDGEGRVVQTEFCGPGFKNVVLVNAYFPNSQREHTRLPFKLKFCQAMRKHCDALQARGKSVILCGDFNIAHQEIDLKNPKSNQDNAGFLPEERAWMTEFLNAGYIDTFRHFNKEPGHYTWWSYRPGVREKNIGWRLDYFCVSPDLRDRLVSVRHQPDVFGSDHCPVILELR